MCEVLADLDAQSFKIDFWKLLLITHREHLILLIVLKFTWHLEIIILIHYFHHRTLGLNACILKSLDLI